VALYWAIRVEYEVDLAPHIWNHFLSPNYDDEL